MATKEDLAEFLRRIYLLARPPQVRETLEARMEAISDIAREGMGVALQDREDALRAPQRKLLILKDDDGEGALVYVSVPKDMLLDDARLKRWMRIAEVYADESPDVWHAENLGEIMTIFRREFPKAPWGV